IRSANSLLVPPRASARPCPTLLPSAVSAGLTYSAAPSGVSLFALDPIVPSGSVQTVELGWQGFRMRFGSVRNFAAVACHRTPPPPAAAWSVRQIGHQRESWRTPSIEIG